MPLDHQEVHLPLKAPYMTETDACGRWCQIGNVKGAVTDMRYFARSKFSRSLVHEKKCSLTWQVVFKLGYVFCQEKYELGKSHERQ